MSSKRRNEPIHLDQIKGEPDTKVAWGSDVAAQMLRRLDIPFISLNPGASYRGFHDSIVNHLGNDTPGMILCLHEDHSVAIAHGYAKVTNKPMACVLHANVGLLHGAMGMFNAWLDRVPMLIFGATGPLDAPKRRPWIDWIHTSRDQGGLVRHMVKWDDQPSSPEALVESIVRGNIMTRAHPTAPVYIVLDAGLQEAKLEHEVEWPDLSRFAPPPPSRPSKESVSAAKAILEKAKRPLIMLGRNSRSEEMFATRVKLAERLGACVMTDLKNGSGFPTNHPAHVVPPFNQLNKEARQIVCEADVILSLDWNDLGGALKQAKSVGKITAKIIHCSLDQNLQNGAHMDYQGLPPIDVPMLANPEAVVTDLLEALGSGAKKEPWRKAAEQKPKAREKLHLSHVAEALKEAIGEPEKVSFTGLGRGWPTDLWPFTHPLSYLGKDGGGGIGSGPGISVGCALALSRMGRLPVAIMGDGDFAMGNHALWSAVHHKIPLLVILNNNRSYFNDELHQETVAVKRGREPSNRWVGQSMTNPELNFARLVEGYGATGIGPVKDKKALQDAIAKGVSVLKSGGVCVIDCHIDPGEERSAQSSLEVRVTD
jgi:thiamine pyrophosphate-dependent acetolactate synthase large subunit-like protein